MCLCKLRQNKKIRINEPILLLVKNYHAHCIHGLFSEYLWSMGFAIVPRGIHMTPPFSRLAYAPIVETSFSELAVSFLDFSDWTLLGTFSILLCLPSFRKFFILKNEWSRLCLKHIWKLYFVAFVHNRLELKKKDIFQNNYFKTGTLKIDFVVKWKYRGIFDVKSSENSTEFWKLDSKIKAYASS